MKTSEALKSASIRLVKQSEMLAAETDPTFTMIRRRRPALRALLRHVQSRRVR